jgi:ketosteroid isomerase-like protein
MSREHVQRLREMYGRTTLPQIADSLHPEAELHQAHAIPDSDDYYGREEFLRGTRRWLEEWEEFRYVPEELVDLGERVLMRVRVSGRARASGVELDLLAFHLWTFQDGMPWRCEVFLDERPALEAAGLRE